MLRFSPCKINLLLNILGRRPDGFHDLETVFLPVPVGDRLVFDRLPEASWGDDAQRIRLTCNRESLPVDGSNLVHKAASAFLRAAGIQANVSIHLEKRLPVSAGLGGGSSNAAHTLLALNEMFDHPLTTENLGSIAAGLGSDINFFLQSRPAMATGRGEVVHPVGPWEILRRGVLALYHPGFGVSTAWAYGELGRYPESLNGKPGRAAELIQALDSGDREAVAKGLYNSLEAPVLNKYPILAMYQEHWRKHGAWATMMSGSGSTTFGLFDDMKSAQFAHETFEEKFGNAGWYSLVDFAKSANP